MNFFASRVIKAYEWWMNAEGVRVIYAGLEDAVILIEAPTSEAIAFVSNLDTPSAALNNIYALAFLKLRIDPTGATTIREAVQDAAVELAPEFAKKIDDIFMDFKTPPRMEAA